MSIYNSRVIILSELTQTLSYRWIVCHCQPNKTNHWRTHWLIL